MTSRGPGRASRTLEMEEKELLRRQIRLLQGLIDDYKNLHGNAPAPGPSAPSRWQPPAYNSSRAFSARYPRPCRRGFSQSHGPAWRKKYSLVNRPPGSLDPPGDCAAQPTLEAGSSRDPDPQQYGLERQVQLSLDQSMVIKIKPPSEPGSASTAGVPRGSWEDRQGPPWGTHRPQAGEGEPPGGQRQPSRPGRAKGTCGTEDPLLVCQKEPGKPRVVKSVSSVGDSPSGPRRTVSESAVSVQARFLSQRPGAALARKVGAHSAASCAAQLLADGRVDAGRPDQPAPSCSVAGPARPASGPRQARESSLLVSCRINKFRKNNYKWVAASAKSPRAPRRALSPRAASGNVCTAPFGAAERAEKLQTRADQDAKPRKSAMSSTSGASSSKYKWKASSPSASSSSSFRWQSEAGSKDRASQLSPVPSRSPPGDKPAVGPSSLKPFSSENPLSAYRARSRNEIVRRRGSTGLPGDKKGSPPPAATAKSQFSLRRRQAFRGKSSPGLKKTPPKSLMQAPRHRPCCLPPGRAHLPKEASSLHTLRTPPTSKVIKTRYRIVKKTQGSPLNDTPFSLSLPSWRTRRLSLSRSLVLNRLRPAVGVGRTQPGSPRWRSKGYRCIGGVLYRVSANKLSKTCSRPGGGGDAKPGGIPRQREVAGPPAPAVLVPPALRPVGSLPAGRLDLSSSCSRSLASRAVQRSLAIVRQARQRRRRKEQEYCMYYNRFGRCNRGERCPYIHDPEKVAVCTRFVRGTCKKTDGTCPFSHHVSKEKVSGSSRASPPVFHQHGWGRDAGQVGLFWPEGRSLPTGSLGPDLVPDPRQSKPATPHSGRPRPAVPSPPQCKKKHTLLCPDFSRRGVCPRGAQCQLLHRSQKRLGRRAAAPPTPEPSDVRPRSKASAGHGPRKSSAAQRPPRQMPSSPTSAATGLASLPSSPQASAAASAGPLSSKAPSSASASPPSPSLSSDQEELSLQEEAASVATGSGSLSQLPSFISLHSSPSPGAQSGARSPRSTPTKDSGKSLHIKPRL
ncbi:zinc finger CCCH domain-containing protein 3 [Pteropus vampyrus]|uniref:Zinc finger CCCH domain-containing protein 3 n=1 Tax=Pteropus vampyrus TaxID=132908 RepID=A0A6P6BLW2_PTEVA|nr:zinc finger CCCH domain-containing protein 3 [Pteropus vampyrus]